MSQRERRESEVGPFGTSPTVLTKPDQIRELLDQMQGAGGGEAGDRATREMDPEVFRSLLREDHVAAQPTQTKPADDDLAIAIAPEEPVPRTAAPATPHAEFASTPATTDAERALPVVPASGVAWQAWILLLIGAFGVVLGLLLAFGE